MPRKSAHNSIASTEPVVATASATSIHGRLDEEPCAFSDITHLSLEETLRTTNDWSLAIAFYTQGRIMGASCASPHEWGPSLSFPLNVCTPAKRHSQSKIRNRGALWATKIGEGV